MDFEERRRQRREAERAQRRAEERREAERERAREEQRDEERREAELQRAGEFEQAEERRRQSSERARAVLRQERAARAREDAAERRRREARAVARREAQERERREEARTEARRGVALGESRAQAREAEREEARGASRLEARRAEEREQQRSAGRREARRTEEREQARQRQRGESRRAAARRAALARARRERAAASGAARPVAARRPDAGTAATPVAMRTRGRFLLDAREQPVTLRGVAARGLERARPDAGRFAHAIEARDLELVGEWGANALLVPIAQDLALEGADGAFGEDYLDALDGTIEAAAAAGMYTVIQLSLLSSSLPTHVESGEDRFDPALPNLESIDLWAALGRRYADTPSAIFQLFRAPHTPRPADATELLVPRLEWPLWRRWLLAMLGEVRRAHPGALVILPGLEHGTDLTGFPIRHTDGTEPANVVYAGALPASGDAGDVRGLDSLRKLRPCCVQELGRAPHPPSAVDTGGRRLARASLHWFTGDVRDDEAPLIQDRDAQPVPTELGRAVTRALAQPPGEEANLELRGAGGPAGLGGLVARELSALILAQAGAVAAPPPTPFDTADAVGNVLLFPVAVAATREGQLAATEGGLVTDAALRPRVSVIVGPGATPRGIAERLVPLYTGAAPAVPAVPPPTAEELAQALLVYSRNFLPVPALREYRVGLRLPVPIEIEPATGAWVLSSARVREWAGGFDPAWAPLLDRRPRLLDPPDPDAAALDAVDFLGAHTTALQRGTGLLARVLTNPSAAVLTSFEVLRLLEDEAFMTALEFFNAAVAHQVNLLATLTAGSATLRRLEPVLAAPPAGLTPQEQQAVARALAMTDAALRPGGVLTTARELPETPQQLADRGAIPLSVQPALQDPPGGSHRIVLGRDVLAGRIGTFPAAPPNFRGPSYVGRIPPAGFIGAHRAHINPLGDARLDARLDIVAAISPNEGALDAIRLQDAGIVSTGIHQWSANFELELPALMWRYRSIAPLEFDLFFRLYGLEVRPNGADGFGNPRFMLQQVAANFNVSDLATFAQRRTFFGGVVVGTQTRFDTVWAARFRMASVALWSFALAQTFEAAERFDRIVREVGNLNVGGINTPLSDVISSRHGVALILDQHINRPAAVRPDLQAAVNFVGPQPTADALDRAVTNRYAATRTLQDAALRTQRIVNLGLDRAHDSFTGW